jgi:hypothetical protein
MTVFQEESRMKTNVVSLLNFSWKEAVIQVIDENIIRASHRVII